MTLREYLSTAQKLGLPRRTLISLLLLSIATTLAESLGLAMVVPIYDYISVAGAGKLPDTFYWRVLNHIAGMSGQEIGLALLLLLAFTSVLLRQIGSYARQVAVAHSRETVTKRVRDDVFKHFLGARLSEQESLKSGELVNALTNELSQFNASLVGFVSLANTAVLIAIYGALLLWTSWQMTVISLSVTLIALPLLRYLYRRTVGAGRASTVANVGAMEFFVERLAPARVIRLAGSERAEIGRMDGFTCGQFDTMMHLERLMALTAVLLEPLILGLVFSLIYIAVAILKVPMASLAIFLMVVLRLLPVAKDLMKGHQMILACAGSTMALLGMLNRLKHAAEGDGGSKIFTGLKRALRFDATSFRYPGADRDALEKIDLTIPAGNFAAIVGPSGAGKSTLIDLLPALREPCSGRILMDDEPIGEFSLATLRKGIAYVPQQANIYDITIAEHVRLGRADANEDDVRDALEIAGAMLFVAKLPLGIHTRLGQAGATLSGGQRQRIDLARAIVSPASILILDEPTSALDAESEKAFIAQLDYLRSKREMTLVIVTHRLSMVRGADQIVVVRDGQVEAAGRLDEVRQSSPWFDDAMKTMSTRVAAVT